MDTYELPQCAQADLFERLESLTAEQLDVLAFGLIGFDLQGIVRRYNSLEAQLAGLSPQRVIGLPLFTAVAPCMNNLKVAGRFDAAAAREIVLDETLDYVFTLRMRPTRVRLRLLAAPRGSLRYVVVTRDDGTR